MYEEMRAQIELLLAENKALKVGFSSKKNKGQYQAKRGQFLRENPGSLDVYLTDDKTVNVAVDYITSSGMVDKNTTFYDPFDGEGAITNEFKRRGYTNVTGTDIRITNGRNVSVDAFTVDYTAFDKKTVIACNGPFGLKMKMLNMILRSGLRVATVLPGEILILKEFQILLQEFGIKILILSPKPTFTRLDGSRVCVGVCIWFFANWGDEVVGQFSGSIISNLNPILLGVDDDADDDDEDISDLVSILSQ